MTRWLRKALSIAIGLILALSVLTAQGQSTPEEEQRLRMRQDMIAFIVESFPKMLLGYGNYQKKLPFGDETGLDYRMSRIWLDKQETFTKTPIRYVEDAEFKTHDIDVNRLAINTGTEILVHANRLASKKEFTFSQAAQLMLHEFNHLVTEVEASPWEQNSEKVKVTLAEKDRFTARFAEYLKAKTWTATQPNSSNQTFSILELDEPRDPRELRPYFSRGQMRDLRYLAWNANDGYFESAKDFWRRIYGPEHQVFNKNLGASEAQHDHVHLLPFPYTEMEELSVDAKGRFSFRVKYTERLFGADGHGPFGMHLPQVYTRVFTQNYDKWERSFGFRKIETQLNFQLENVIEKDGRGYVTIRVAGDDSAALESFLSGKNLSIQARDKDGNRFSFPATALKNTRSRHRLQFHLPEARDLILTEILSQSGMRSIDYQETSVRPGLPQKLQFPTINQAYLQPLSRTRALNWSDLWMGTSDTHLSFTMPFDLKDVRGVTMEIRVPVQVIHNYTPGVVPLDQQRPSYFQTRGFKMYLNKAKLKEANQRNNRYHGFAKEYEGFKDQYTIEMDRRSFAEGKTLLDPNLNDLGRDQRHLLDFGLRGVTNIWLHMENGQNIKLEIESEPVARVFTRPAQSWPQRKPTPRDPRAPIGEPGAPSCKKVYGGR